MRLSKQSPARNPGARGNLHAGKNAELFKTRGAGEP